MANRLEIVVGAKTGDAEKGLESLRKNIRKVGLGLSAMGAAGVLAIKSFADAALEQRRAMGVLAATVENTGVAFDSVKEKILATTAALQDKTNFGDEEQMRALANMVPILGDVDMAMEALPAIMDAASSSGKSLETVSRTLTRALSGQVNTAITIGMAFDKNADFGERLAQVFGKVGGSAEANVDPMKQLADDVGDLKEVIGEALLPTLMIFIEKGREIAKRLQEIDPNVLKVAGTIAVLATAFAAIGGPILLFIGFVPQIVLGLGAIKLAVMGLLGSTGIGLLLPLIGMLALVMVTKWDVIKDKTIDVINVILGVIGPFVKSFVDKINVLIRAWNKVNIGMDDISEIVLDTQFKITKQVEVNIDRYDTMNSRLVKVKEAIKQTAKEAAMPWGVGARSKGSTQALAGFSGAMEEAEAADAVLRDVEKERLIVQEQITEQVKEQQVVEEQITEEALKQKELKEEEQKMSGMARFADPKGLTVQGIATRLAGQFTEATGVSTTGAAMVQEVMARLGQAGIKGVSTGSRLTGENLQNIMGMGWQTEGNIAAVGGNMMVDPSMYMRGGESGSNIGSPMAQLAQLMGQLGININLDGAQLSTAIANVVTSEEQVRS